MNCLQSAIFALWKRPLCKDSVTEKISATASDNKNYMTQFYYFDAFISVGLISSVSSPTAYQYLSGARPRRSIGTQCSQPCQPNHC